jgi:hypothetical protein
MLLIFIPIAVVWLAIATFVVCLCRAAALADADGVPREPRRGQCAEVIVLERVPARTRARGHMRSRPARSAALRPRGLASIHSLR